MTTRARGFTLLELLAAVAVMGLIVGMTAWSLTGRLTGARMEEVIGQVAAMDGWARQAARNSGRAVRLVFDLRAGTVARADREGMLSSQYRLPAGYSLLGLVRADAPRPDGERAVEFAAGGWSASYAVQLSGPGGRECWVLFAGWTGDRRVFDDDDQVQETFRAVAGAAGPDAR